MCECECESASVNANVKASVYDMQIINESAPTALRLRNTCEDTLQSMSAIILLLFPTIFRVYLVLSTEASLSLQPRLNEI